MRPRPVCAPAVLLSLTLLSLLLCYADAVILLCCCRDTPQPHIQARHRQAEAAAKDEVRKALLKKGVSLYKYVEGG